jgi:hypothetical protein
MFYVRKELNFETQAVFLNAETSTANWGGMCHCAAAADVVHSPVCISIQTQDRVPYSRQYQLSLCSCKQVCRFL